MVNTAFLHFILFPCSPLIHIRTLSCLACFIQFDENIRIILKRFDLDQGLGDLLSERKALVVPEPEPDSDSNQERKDERERGEAPGWKQWKKCFSAVDNVGFPF